MEQMDKAISLRKNNSISVPTFGKENLTASRMVFLELLNLGDFQIRMPIGLLIRKHMDFILDLGQ